MRAILNKQTIATALQRDPLLQKSLGVAPTFVLSRGFALLWLGWMILLILTPLPEIVLLHRVSLLLALLLGLIFLGLDKLRNASRQARMGELLFHALEADPKLVTRRQGKLPIVQLTHARFSGECQLDTALLLAEMTETELETVHAIEDARNPETQKDGEKQNTPAPGGTEV